MTKNAPTVANPEPLSSAREGGAQRLIHTFTLETGSTRERLDRFLAARLEEHGVSREKIKRMIRDGAVRVNDVPCDSPKETLSPGSRVSITLEAAQASLAPEEGQIHVIYRDSVLAVLNKPAGITVHPAPSCPTGTLAHRLVAHFPELAEQEGFRPGIVHRLDKDTSGLLLVALSEKARLALAEMFAGHAVHKEYLALVRGVLKTPCGEIEAPVGRHPHMRVKMAVTPAGRYAKSAWKTLYADPDGRFSLVLVRIFTGRTHQIRVHMEHLGHPLLGDAVYRGETAGAPGKKKREATEPDTGRIPLPPLDIAPRQMLHAWKLAFAHPFAEAVAPQQGAASGCSMERQGGTLHFTCPPPKDFEETAASLAKGTVRVVITGSPGCGKSALLASLEAMGVPVFSADAYVKELYAPGGHGQYLLRARYGERFVPGPNSPVDKARLGAAMRASGTFRREVEALLHPLVFQAVEAFWTAQAETGVPLAAAEIPVYFETAAGRRPGGSSPALPEGVIPFAQADASLTLPVLVGVHCPFAIRRERLMHKRGWDEETIAFMESWQWPEYEKMRACHMVIDNTGDVAALEQKARTLRERLLALREERGGDLLRRLRRLWATGAPP